jgi:hypothetical protein
MTTSPLTVTVEVPVFFTVTLMDWVLPTATLPKLADEGLKESVPAARAREVELRRVSRTAAIFKTFRKREDRKLTLSQWLPEETAEKMPAEKHRGPKECIPQSGYGFAATGIY